MPIIEKDPWRMQYFDGVPCSDGVSIPTGDEDAYILYPEYRWIYNKLRICDTQGLAAAPHGVIPKAFPVFSKPIYNLRGMGAGGKIIHTIEEYENEMVPGHFWMPLMTGEHVSTDVAVLNGEPKWWRHTTGKAIEDGMFDHWVIQSDARADIENYCGDWIRRYMLGYCGMVNFETIGGKIVEGHLRFADQWPDLYGAGWVESLVDLYSRHHWRYRDEQRQTGYSVVLFGGHGLHYHRPSQEIIDELLDHPSISSIQITFHQDKPPESHAMPPGGFRLAIINCWDLDAGIEARQKLALSFWSTQKLRRRRNKNKPAA